MSSHGAVGFGGRGAAQRLALERSVPDQTVKFLAVAEAEFLEWRHMVSQGALAKNLDRNVLLSIVSGDKLGKLFSSLNHGRRCEKPHSTYIRVQDDKIVQLLKVRGASLNVGSSGKSHELSIECLPLIQFTAKEFSSRDTALGNIVADKGCHTAYGGSGKSSNGC